MRKHHPGGKGESPGEGRTPGEHRHLAPGNRVQVERTREKLYSLEAVCGPAASSHGYGLRNDGARGLLRDQSRDASGKQGTSRGAAIGDEPVVANREGNALKGPWPAGLPARDGRRTGNSMRVRNRFFDRMVFSTLRRKFGRESD
jgi:hypothetical protein